MILRRSSRTDPRLVLGTALAFALPLGANPAALAQTPPAKAPVQAPVAPGPVPYLAPQPALPGSPPTDADALKQRDQELEAARARERESAENQAKLKREIEALGDDRRALNQQLIDTAAHVRGVEASIEATEGRLKPLDEQETPFSEIARRTPRGDHRDSRRPATGRAPAAAGADGAAGGCAAGGAHGHHARRRAAGDAGPGRGARWRPRRPPAGAQATLSPNATTSRAISPSLVTTSCA